MLLECKGYEIGSHNAIAFLRELLKLKEDKFIIVVFFFICLEIGVRVDLL